MVRHLRAFCHVAEEGHFGRAAARLVLSQPALSVQSRQLEAIVGTKVFERHTRQVALTDAGRAFEEGARRVLMRSRLAHVIRTYRQHFPGVRVDLRELMTAEQMEARLAGDLDVGIVRGAEPDPRLQASSSRASRWSWPSTAITPGARRARLPLAALADDPWELFPRAIAPSFHDQVMALCREAGFTPRVVQESREVHPTVGLVGAGVGVTVIPETVRRMTGTDVVEALLPRASVPLSMVRPAGTPRPVVQHFLAVAREARRSRG